MVNLNYKKTLNFNNIPYQLEQYISNLFRLSQNLILVQYLSLFCFELRTQYRSLRIIRMEKSFKFKYRERIECFSFEVSRISQLWIERRKEKRLVSPLWSCPGLTFFHQRSNFSTLFKTFYFKGSSINDVMVSEGRGKQRFLTTALKLLVLKGVTMGEGVSNIIKNCVTSFMDDP